MSVHLLKAKRKHIDPAKRVEHDFYPTTPTEPIRGLLHRERRVLAGIPIIWEPACGDGALVREIRGAGHHCVASDLVERGCPNSWTGDFFDQHVAPGRALITNPPYNLVSAAPAGGKWLRHALSLDLDYIALLLSWDWPAARANGLGDLLDANPFAYAYLLRWKVDFTGKGSPPQRNAWFVWRKGWKGSRMGIRFMDKTDGAKLRPARPRLLGLGRPEAAE